MIAKHLGLPRTKGAEGFLAAIIIDALGSGLFVPFSLLYFHVAASLPLVNVGFALSTAAICTIPIVFLAGLLVDRFSARHIVIAAQVLQGCGVLGYLLVNNIFSLVVYASLALIGQRLFWSSYFVLIADLATKEERDRWYGLAGAAQSIGIGVGGLASGFLVASSGLIGYHLIVGVDALSFFLAALLLLFSLRKPGRQSSSQPQSTGYRLVLQDWPFLALTATNIIFAIGSMLLGIGIPLHLEALKVPVWVVGAIFAFNTVLLATIQTLIVRLLEPYRRTRILMLAGVLWSGWCLLCTLALAIPSVVLIPYLFGITCIYSLAELMHAPTSNALAAAASPEALRGRYLALFQFAWSIASILTPGLFTLLFAMNTSLPWLSAALLLLVASFALFLLERRLPTHAVRPSAMSADQERVG